MHGLRLKMLPELAAALPKIKRLTMTGSYHTIESILEVLEYSRILFADLEYLSVNSFAHGCTGGGSSKLELPTYYSSNVSPVHLSRILRYCRSLESFVWSP